MARGRKAGPAIKCITGRDFELMQGIARTRVTSNFDVRQIIGLSEKRLKNMFYDTHFNKALIRGLVVRSLL